MSNYLKKLAYIKRELVKLAASNVHDGFFINMPMSYDLGLPTVEDYRRSGALREQPDPDDGSIGNPPGYGATDRGSVPIVYVSDRTQLPETPIPGTKPVETPAVNLTDDQRWQNVMNYQRELLKRMVATGRFGKGQAAIDAAKAKLKSKNRWYDTRNLGQYKGKRFESIANGTRGYMKVKGEGQPYGAFNNYAATSGTLATAPPTKSPTRTTGSTTWSPNPNVAPSDQTGAAPFAFNNGKGY